MQALSSAPADDVYILLYHLHTHDVRARGQHFLPPTSQINIARLLPARPMPHVRGLRDQLSSQRLRIALLLCYCASLLAPITSPNGKLLKPAPAVAPWLDLPMPQRAEALIRAFFADDSAAAQWWVKLRLTGWRVVQAGLKQSRPFRFSDVLWALLNGSATAHSPARLIASALPVPLVPNAAHPDLLPETLQHALIQLLLWFGLLLPARAGSSALRIHPRIRALAKPLALMVAPAARKKPSLMLRLLQAPRGGTVGALLIAPAAADWAAQWELGQIAHLTSASPRTYTLDRHAVLRAFDTGFTLQAAHDLIERVTGAPAPRSVYLLLCRWQAEHQQARIDCITVLRVESPQLLDELYRRKRTRACLRQRLAADAAEVRMHRMAALLRRLHYRGIIPRISFALPSHRARVDGCAQQDWAHIYQSLLLAHHLPEIIPLAWRAPAALVESVAMRLPPAQAQDIQAQVRELARYASQQRDAAAARAHIAAPEGVLPTITISDIERAITDQHPLRITYHTIGDNTITERDIMPLQLEWRGAQLYLIAHDSLSREPRTFRVDRILALAGCACTAEIAESAEVA